MAKEYGITVGKKLKVFGFRSGISNSGKYKLFGWTEKTKDATGTYVPTQKYTIYITNEEDLVLNDGQDIVITKILGVIPSWNSYTDKTGVKRNERVIIVRAEISLDSGENANPIIDTDESAKATNSKPTPKDDDNPFSDLDDDSFDFD